MPGCSRASGASLSAWQQCFGLVPWLRRPRLPVLESFGEQSDRALVPDMHMSLVGGLCSAACCISKTGNLWRCLQLPPGAPQGRATREKYTLMRCLPIQAHAKFGTVWLPHAAISAFSHSRSTTIRNDRNFVVVIGSQPSEALLPGLQFTRPVRNRGASTHVEGSGHAGFK
jgi:hypothetical protein